LSSSLPTDTTARVYEPKLHLLKKVDSSNLDVPFSNLTNSSMVNSPTLDIKLSESTPPISGPIKHATKRLISFADRDRPFEIAQEAQQPAFLRPVMLDTVGCREMGFDIYNDNELDVTAVSELECSFATYLNQANMKELNVANFLDCKNKYESPEVRKEIQKNASRISHNMSVSSNSVVGAGTSSIFARR
jgi:hypothetical protein